MTLELQRHLAISKGRHFPTVSGPGPATRPSDPSQPTLPESARLYLQMKDGQSTGEAYHITGPTKKLTCFLSSNEMEAIRTDMKNTVYPSWFQPAPQQFGEPKAGKLIADQWRNLCTVHMLITLVRLWATRSDRQLHLKNFMFLLIAVQAATSRSTSPALVKCYDASILLYLKTLPGLYPGYKFSINQHMALHVGKYLRLFGPAHGHWAFPFERLNGFFRRVRTNFHIGEPILRAFPLIIRSNCCRRRNNGNLL